MGSLITLGIGKLEIDWGKNNIYNSHAKLFLPGDIINVPYYYSDYYSGKHSEKRPAYRRNLLSVRRRLALLGYTMDRCREIFEASTSYSERFEYGHTVSWSDFTAVLNKVDLDKADAFYEVGQDDYDLGEYVEKNILSNPHFEGLLHKESHYSQRSISIFLENIDPYVTLCILANNPKNKRRYVVWRHVDILDEEWVDPEDIKPGLAPEDKYLVVTEGSSDSTILQKSLNILFPDVADFFSFIDMTKHYPFTGTGNLVNFCTGLARIGIQNKVLVVVDNDTAGLNALRKINGLTLPSLMKITALPDMTHLKKFRTLGPSGFNYEDVNGRAASIELYLDLRHGGPKPPTIRWTSYDDYLDAYQGALIDKEKYAKAFIKRSSISNGYSLAHLKEVWRALFKTCTGESF